MNLPIITAVFDAAERRLIIPTLVRCLLKVCCWDTLYFYPERDGYRVSLTGDNKTLHCQVRLDVDGPYLYVELPGQVLDLVFYDRIYGHYYAPDWILIHAPAQCQNCWNSGLFSEALPACACHVLPMLPLMEYQKEINRYLFYDCGIKRMQRLGLLALDVVEKAGAGMLRILEMAERSVLDSLALLCSQADFWQRGRIRMLENEKTSVFLAGLKEMTGNPAVKFLRKYEQELQQCYGILINRKDIQYIEYSIVLHFLANLPKYKGKIQ